MSAPSKVDNTFEQPSKPATGKSPAGKQEAKPEFSPKQLALGLFFGLIFGFLLQKGGVAKYHILLGVLLLEDMTVIQLMLTAIVVGSVGVFALYSWGKVKLHIKPTRYAANIVGGLIFGVGFALNGYCPGTGAAALGQGNWDSIAGIAGLMLGSYIYAEASRGLGNTLLKVGDRGKIMLPELVGVQRNTFLAIFIPLLIASLFALHYFSPS